MTADDKFCMKHLIFLILLVLVSCSGEMGADGSSGNSNNNSSNNRNGGTNIFDDIIPDANAGFVEENGCLDGYSRITVLSNEESGSYYSCIKTTPLETDDLYSPGTGTAAGNAWGSLLSSYCRYYHGSDTCSENQIFSAFHQGKISETNRPVISASTQSVMIWRANDQGIDVLENYLNTDPDITHAYYYCCYR